MRTLVALASVLVLAGSVGAAAQSASSPPSFAAPKGYATGRFPDSVAESLRRIAWWDWPDEIIFERLSDFRSEAIEQFCERYDPAVAASR